VYVNNRRERSEDRRVGRDDLLADAYVVVRRGKRRYHLVRFA
jgi:tyrosyl-tRNA synthetase